MRIVEGHMDKVKGRKNPFAAFCVGAGRAEEVLREDFQEHLRMLQDTCHFRYMRFHGLFHDDMGVYREDKNGNAYYNWQYIDKVYDSLLDSEIRPFVELSFMPWDMASGEAEVFWWKANITLPGDFEKWYRLVQEFTKHVTERYGEDEVKKWFFEVWNEPNHPGFFVEEMESYFKLYQYSAQAVKSVNPDYRVGGPASAGNMWIPELIDYCTENYLPLDFISTHAYGVEGVFDEFGQKAQRLKEDTDVLIKEVKMVRKQVKQSAMPDLPVYYTEWSSSYSPRDNMHDSYIQAPYILYNLKRMDGFVDAMSYWTFTDVLEEAGPPATPFHGGFGLINLQGIKKPAYFAYEYLCRLGETELLNTDEDSYICRQGDEVQILLWNYTHLKQEEENQTFFIRDLKPAGCEEVKVRIQGMKSGIYELLIFCTGYEKNDVYSDYVAIGKPDTLSRKTVKALKEHNNGEPQEIRLLQVENTFRMEFSLRDNDVYYLELKKID